MSKKRSYGVMLDHNERLAINEALRTSGFDGNGRFSSVTEALSLAQGVLDGFGIEVDQVLSSHLFPKPGGNALIHLAFSNKKDPFSPTSIENAALAFSWHRLTTEESHRKELYESLAYVS